MSEVKLTPEQKKKVPLYAELYSSIAKDTKPVNRPVAEKLFAEIYKYHGYKPAKQVIWTDSPRAMATLAAKMLYNTDAPTQEQIKGEANKAHWGSYEAYWVAYYAFDDEVLGRRKDDFVDVLKQVVRECGAYITYEDVVIACEKPSEVHIVDGKLHNPEGGPVIAYKDGFSVYIYERNGQPMVTGSVLEATIQWALGEV